MAASTGPLTPPEPAFPHHVAGNLQQNAQKQDVRRAQCNMPCSRGWFGTRSTLSMLLCCQQIEARDFSNAVCYVERETPVK